MYGVQISSRPFFMKTIIYLLKMRAYVNRESNLHLRLYTSSTSQTDGESPGGKTMGVLS